jgi:hypothetical protein
MAAQHLAEIKFKVQYKDSYTEKVISKVEEACSQEYTPTGKKKGFFEIKRIYRLH